MLIFMYLNTDTIGSTDTTADPDEFSIAPTSAHGTAGRYPRHRPFRVTAQPRRDAGQPRSKAFSAPSTVPRHSTRSPGAPPLAYVSWPDAGAVIGVDRQGTIYTSDDNGDTWQSRHGLNQKPQALLADGNVDVCSSQPTPRSTNHEQRDHCRTTLRPQLISDKCLTGFVPADPRIPEGVCADRSKERCRR